MYKINTKKLFWIAYFIALALPIGNNNLYSYICIFSIGSSSINIIEIILIIISSIIVCKNFYYIRKELINVVNIYMLILFCMYLIYMYIGLKKGYNALGDVTPYLIQAMFYFSIINLYNDKDNIYKFMNITFYALLVNCSINLIMYITQNWSFWGVSAYFDDRFGGNYYTLLIITISYGFHLLYNKSNEIKKTTLILSFIISIICTLLNKSRTHLLLTIVSCLIILIFSLFNKKSKRSVGNKIIFLIFTMFILYIGISTFLNSNSEFAKRILEINIFSSNDTGLARIYTVTYNYNLFLENIWGEGFGCILPTVFSSGNVHIIDTVFNIDNTFLSIARKAGVITLVLYTLLILYPIYSLIRIYIIRKDKIYISIAIAYVMLLIASTILTSQSIHSYAVSTFIWVFIGFINIHKIEVIKKNNKNIEVNS